MCGVSDILGFESATKGDSVFRDLVLARIIEPTSKIDAGRVLTEVGIEPASYATLKRRLRARPHVTPPPPPHSGRATQPARLRPLLPMPPRGAANTATDIPRRPRSRPVRRAPPGAATPTHSPA